MVIFLWIVIDSVVVSTAIALFGCKRSKLTLSEIAEKLETLRDRDVAGDILD
jgi:hypothetical protein